MDKQSKTEQDTSEQKQGVSLGYLLFLYVLLVIIIFEIAWHWSNWPYKNN